VHDCQPTVIELFFENVRSASQLAFTIHLHLRFFEGCQTGQQSNWIYVQLGLIKLCDSSDFNPELISAVQSMQQEAVIIPCLLA
jgi:hypothetical protein